MKTKQLLITIMLIYFSTVILAQNCNNLGYEVGSFTNWEAWTGQATGIISPTIPVMYTQGFVASRHQITSSGFDFWSGIPMVSPTGGMYSAQLGNSQPGGQAEQLRQKFLVTSSNASYVYQYAVVLEDPGHIGRPLFEIKIYDTNDSIIPCGDYLVRADQGLPGFNSQSVQTASGVHYIVSKNWTDVAVDLSPYIGDSITVEFTTADCNAGQHFGYAYIDGYCQVLDITAVSQNCTSTIDLNAPNGYQNYLWSNGMTGQNITVASSTPGDSITVTLVPFMGCNTELTYHFTLSSTPVANFLALDTCVNIPIQFIDSSYSNIVSWLWDFGDGQFSILQNPAHIYSNSGSYNVQLIVANNSGCSDTIVKPINICASNSANYTYLSICNQSVFFTDITIFLPLNLIVSWLWNFGDGVTSTVQNPSHIYVQNGTYSVSMMVTYADNSMDTVIQNVIVLAQPQANFSSISSCLGGDVSFNNTSTISAGSITNYQWLFGDGNMSSQQNPVDTFNSSGTFLNALEVTASNGCKDTIIRPVVVHHLPQTQINTLPPSGCEPVEVSFNAVCTDVADTILFDSFDMTFNTTFNYNTPVTNNGSQYIMVVSGVFNVWGDPTRLLDAGYNFDYSSGITLQSNLFVSGPYTNLRPVPDVYDFQRHLYYYYFTGDGNAINFNFTDSNYSDNTGMFHYDVFEIKPACNNFSYLWGFGNGVNLSSQSAILTYNAQGSYNVILDVTNNETGCTNSFADVVTVYPNSTASFNFNTPCEGIATNFMDQSQSNIALWNWSFGDGNTSVQQNPNHIYSTGGSYNVELIVENSNGCADTIIQGININSKPGLDFSIPQQGCEPLNVQLIGSSNSTILAWSWNLGNGETPATQNITTNYLNEGSYDVSLTVIDDKGCENSLTQINYINVYPNPIADFSSTPDDVTEFDPTIYFTDLSQNNISLWSWSFGDGNTSTFQNPSNDYKESGDYLVSLYVENIYGCSAQIEELVIIKPVFTFYVPNAFTPGGDGDNDTFKGKGINIEEYNMRIFNRWGEMIFETPDLHKGWDGTYQGKVVPNDVYVYKIKLEDVLGEKHDYIGSVNLIK